MSKKDIAGALAQQSLVALAVQHMAAGNQGIFYYFLLLVEVIRGDVVRLDVTWESETVFHTPTTRVAVHTLHLHLVTYFFLNITTFLLQNPFLL
jgi:hypothetical protein